LEISCLLPFLKAGMTLACFSIRGKVPIVKKWLINELNGLQITWAIFLMMVGGMTS
jgi:hypothetical protein